MNEQESLALITQMINKAKCDYEETGVGALIWGCIVMLCSLLTFGNFYWHIQWINYIWFLTLIAVIPQIIISIRAAKKKKYKTHNDDAMSAIWISFGISLFLISMFTGKYPLSSSASLFLIMYGIPTFSTGYIYAFKPMIIGGIIFWLFAIICLYINFPYTMLYTAAGALTGWFIPGLILRRRYLKAKEKNV